MKFEDGYEKNLKGFNAIALRTTSWLQNWLRGGENPVRQSKAR